MDENDISDEEVTKAVQYQLDKRGVKKSWFYKTLFDISQPTFDSRLKGTSKWTKLEKSILIQERILGVEVYNG